MASRQREHHEKHDAADERHPVQANQRAPHHQAGLVDGKLGEGHGSENCAKEDQGAQPNGEHKIGERVKRVRISGLIPGPGQ